MKRISFVFCCIMVLAACMAVCTPLQAQRAMENADEFAEKAEEQALDGNVRSPSNSNAQIQWDDTTVSTNSQQSQPSGQSQQDQQY